MAMQFNLQSLPETPDYLGAEVAKGNFEQQRANAAQLRRQGLMSGLGSSIMGAKELGLLDKVFPSLASPTTAAPAVTGAVSAAPAATGAAGAGAAGAGPLAGMGPIGWGALAALALSSLF